MLTVIFHQGCCQSTRRDPDHTSTSAASHPNASSISTSGNSALAASRTSDTNDSSAALRGPTSARTAPRLRPSDAHNKPLRRHGWMSRQPWTRSQLDRERDAFFDTRVTGRPEIWNAIRMACDTVEHDLETAQTILDAAGVTLPTGDLANGAYDAQGNLYTLLEHCICDPTNLADTPANPSPPDQDAASTSSTDEEAEMRRAAKGKGVEGDMLMVGARLSDRGGPDVNVTLGKQQAVKVLARRVQDEAGITGSRKVRIAYMGRILKENEPLPAQGWSEGHVVNALVFSPS
ncbi:MAG: hypothetical protein M1817_001573 [Caeruleum heppii]|nr:MAG: hypothetical protein M1817_001573 [Caeruleum heppii]